MKCGLYCYLGILFRISKADDSFPSAGPTTGSPQSQCGKQLEETSIWIGTEEFNPLYCAVSEQEVRWQSKHSPLIQLKKSYRKSFPSACAFHCSEGNKNVNMH